MVQYGCKVSLNLQANTLDVNAKLVLFPDVATTCTYPLNTLSLANLTGNTDSVFSCTSNERKRQLMSRLVPYVSLYCLLHKT